MKKRNTEVTACRTIHWCPGLFCQAASRFGKEVQYLGRLNRVQAQVQARGIQ